MDYILFQSQFSPSCKKLLQQFPNLSEKSVSVDSQQMRRYIKKLHIVCVPTLILIMGNKIIERIVGFEPIQNWLLITIYRANQISQPSDEELEEPPRLSQPVSQTIVQPAPQIVPSEPQTSAQSTPQTTVQPVAETTPVPPRPQQTSLDDLILTDENEEDENPVEDRNEPIIQMGSGTNTMMLAEALKKERDNSFDPKKKISA
jgi:hypothetical protein